MQAAELRLRVFAGPRPADALRRLSAHVGRQPRPPAPFVLGPWYQPRDDEAQILQRLQRRDVPLSLAQTYTHYLPCESQRGREEAERSRVARLHRAGLAVTTYFNPMICTAHTRYGARRRDGRAGAGRGGGPYVYRYSTLERFEVAQFDFTARPAARRTGGFCARRWPTVTTAGWRISASTRRSTPPSRTAATGAAPTISTPPSTTAARTAPLRARRASCARAGRAPRACAPVVWGGDPSVDWGFDGLRSAVINGLTMGLSGVSTWGSDIGGFFALLENRLTPELLIRWIQLGAVSGVMRTQANGIRIPDSERPQVWDPAIVGHWRRWAKLRTQLYPYLAAADAHYRRTGLPIMRHLALVYPRDRRASAAEDAFMFGPDLLAAPVVRPGARRRSLRLPRGSWVDLWRSARFLPRTGGLALGRARVLEGGRAVRLPAPLGSCRCWPGSARCSRC